MKLHANLPLERRLLNKLHTNYIAGLYVAEISKKRPYELDGKQAYQEMNIEVTEMGMQSRKMSWHPLFTFGVKLGTLKCSVLCCFSWWGRDSCEETGNRR